MNYAFSQGLNRNRKEGFEITSDVSRQCTSQMSMNTLQRAYTQEDYNDYNFYPRNGNISPRNSFIIVDERIENRGTGITNIENLEVNCLIRLRGIPGCTTCKGAGYKSSTDKFGYNLCTFCTEMANKFLPRRRGIDGCRFCNGDGFIACGSDSLQPCPRCLKLTGYCSSCLDSGYKLLAGTKCDHRRT